MDEGSDSAGQRDGAWCGTERDGVWCTTFAKAKVVHQTPSLSVPKGAALFRTAPFGAFSNY
ncbi:MAG: hypothetical protein FWE41_08395 [Coriobacteriia bacterium]|nr:hypothetical protein [Coriobacteriia bacterium]MCL2749729.1 hypothetical protein [Coriobacteriia bacterium]